MRPVEKLLITGGAGFIGSAFIRYLLRQEKVKRIVNLDCLTYAALPGNLEGCVQDARYRFVQGNILDTQEVEKILEQEGIDAIVHFAAETHVDRSISSARPFFEANVMGTLSLLEALRRYPKVHFHHISTDEVYGSLGEGGAFSEHSTYHPNSPYAASKAASDHLVRSFAHTYLLSTTISHCSNNYGPGQYVEKFLPLMILHALQDLPLPVYGKGANVRDWLYVDDHVEAIWAILQNGRKGETYDIGGRSELANLDLLHLLIELLAEEMNEDPARYHSLIQFVEDRPGHDFRYAIDPGKVERELRWRAKTDLRQGLRATIQWVKEGSAKLICPLKSPF